MGARYGPKSGEAHCELDAWPIGAGMRQKSDDFAADVIADGTFEGEILLRPTKHSQTSNLQGNLDFVRFCSRNGHASQKSPTNGRLRDF